jgi:hypothetical protein
VITTLNDLTFPHFETTADAVVAVFIVIAVLFLRLGVQWGYFIFSERLRRRGISRRLRSKNVPPER